MKPTDQTKTIKALYAEISAEVKRVGAVAAARVCKSLSVQSLYRVQCGQNITLENFVALLQAMPALRKLPQGPSRGRPRESGKKESGPEGSVSRRALHAKKQRSAKKTVSRKKSDTVYGEKPAAATD